ncbi:MAG: hypothetical protein IJS67_02840 [Clostridia bacterium]|nr:hypothetical protein [Clostridia bacterium]
MKSSKDIEGHLLERNQSLKKLKKAVGQEQLYLREKQYKPLFSALNEIEKQHKKTDQKILEAAEMLIEIENMFEELKI